MMLPCLFGTPGPAVLGFSAYRLGFHEADLWARVTREFAHDITLHTNDMNFTSLFSSLIPFHFVYRSVHSPS